MATVTKKLLVSSILGGVLMGSAFLHPFFWWAGVVGLAVVLWGVIYAEKRQHALWCGVLAGTIKMLFAIGWFWTVYPLDWIHHFNPTLELVSIGWVWFSVSVVIGISLGCFTTVAHICMQHQYRYFLVPILYVGSEVLGSIFFSLYALSPLNGLNAHFSFGYLGYSLAGHGLLGMLALYGGVYTLSALAGFLAILLLWVWNTYHERFTLHRRVLVYSVVAVLVIFGAYFITIPVPASESKTRVVAVQTHFPHTASIDRSGKADRVRTLLEVFKVALETDSDAIVFPETASALSVFNAKEDVFAFMQSYTDHDVVVIDSEQVPDQNGQRIIRADIYDSKTHSVAYAYKNYLVPVGEFLPYSISAIMRFVGFGETVELLGRHMAFVPNVGSTQDIPDTLPGVLFCSESLSPVGALLASHYGSAPFVVHPVSHAWFHTPKSLWYQLDLMLRTQVRMAHVPLVQASNMGEPHAYNAYGVPLVGKVVFTSASTSVIQYEF